MIEPYQRALSLVGVPFRFQGRNPSLGLDCIGVIIEAFELRLSRAPTYRVTDGDWSAVERELSPWFRQSARRYPNTNDLAVFRLARSFHFGVVCDDHLVHADAAVGRVVARRMPERLGRDCRLFSYIVE